MIGPLGRLGAAATLGQHCPQMTQRRCKLEAGSLGKIRSLFAQPPLLPGMDGIVPSAPEEDVMVELELELLEV